MPLSSSAAVDTVSNRKSSLTWDNIAPFRLPLTAFLVMLAGLYFTPYRYVAPGAGSAIQILSHHLGHEINSIWVGVGIILLLIPSAAALRQGRYDGWAWKTIDAIALDFLLIDAIFRRFLPWPRPGNPSAAGFPSGHATFAFLMAWLIWQRYPKLGPVWFAMAATIGWSRFVVSAHYPYQIIAGALLGSGLGLLIPSRNHGVLLPRILLPNTEAVGAKIAVS